MVRVETRRSTSYSRAARRASRAAAPPAFAGWGTYATIIAFGLAVCLTGYLAIGENERAFYATRSAAASLAPAPPQAEPASNALPAPKAERTMQATVAGADPSYEAVADEHVAVFESLGAGTASRDRKPARPTRRAKSPIVAQGPGNGPSALAVTRPEVAPVEAAAPAPSAEPMATDRWQQFVSALASCERETLIVGLVCKERARLRYCESAWGELPHCPVAVASLNTR